MIQCNKGYSFNENNQCLNSICGDSIIVGLEECNDGTDVQLDGCFQYIRLQLIMFNIPIRVCIRCQEGFKLEKNQCIISCGDGIQNQEFEECDDQNNLTRDGCYNCYLEEGFICNYQNGILFQSCERCLEINCMKCSYKNQQQICLQCIDGYFIDSLQMCSGCDKICINCTSSSKNCLTFNSQVYQLKDCDQNLGLYYDFDVQDCISQCGDGIISGLEQCDDNNLYDFDGCNNQCQIEQGFLFNLLDNYFMIEPNILVQSKQSNNNYFSIVADQFQETINCSAISISIEYFNYTDLILVSMKYKIIVNWSFLTLKLLNLPILFIFSQDLKIILKENCSMKNQQKKLFQFLKDKLRKIYGINFQIYIEILNNFYFQNVNYPENVRFIFQQATWGNIINFPTISVLNQPTDSYYFQAQLKFTEKDVDPLFFNNIQIVIIFILQVIFTHLISRCILIIISFFYKQQVGIKTNNPPIFSLDKKIEVPNTIQKSGIEHQEEYLHFKPKIPKLVKQLRDTCTQSKYYFIANLLKTVQLSYLDILLAIVLQISNQQTAQNHVVKANLIFAILTILFIIYMIALSYQISVSHQIKLENKYFQRKYGSFYEDIKTNSKLGMIYSFANLLRKKIFIIATVLLYDHPIYQTCICFFSCFFNIMLLITFNPFQSKQQYILNLIPDLCILIIVAITIIFAFQDQHQFFQDSIIYQFGWIVGGCIYCSIFLQLIFLIKELAQSTFEQSKALITYLKNRCR